ncbi:MAG: signal peptidase I [Candidatus Omnitrophica bacterium]|jgi:signal peptidase I|nr:signal peptidase I [Candidatus Omnitrophota bacterium]
MSQQKDTRKKSVIREWVESLLIAFLLAMVIRILIVEPFKIPTGSMRTTLLEGDIILVNKFTYGARIPLINFRLPGIRQPKRGDVIVFIYPLDEKKNFIKRLVALSGETVEIKNGTVYVNDKPLLDPIFNQRYYYNRGDFAQEGQKIEVPKGSYFVMGDNSASSQDSRYWGFVPHKSIVGKAMFIYWPPQRMRLIR